MPYFKEKCYFEYMKKILLLANLLLVCSCNGSISGSLLDDTRGTNSLSSKGKLISCEENVSYYIDYDKHTYEIIREIDEETHNIVKADSVDFDSVFYVPRDYEKYRTRNNEYLVYEHAKELFIYYEFYKY